MCSVIQIGLLLRLLMAGETTEPIWVLYWIKNGDATFLYNYQKNNIRKTVSEIHDSYASWLLVDLEKQLEPDR